MCGVSSARDSLHSTGATPGFVPDLVVQQKLIVDTKTIDRITDHERGQMLNYLRITTLPVGIILNFKHARLEWERLVLSGEQILDGNKEELIL